MTREQYARGVDTLWNEQCEQYARGMMHAENMGRCSLAQQQVEQATMLNRDRGWSILVDAKINHDRHAEQYPDAYRGWTAEPIADRQPTDTLVPDRQIDRWAIEAEANAILHAADEAMPGLDVTVRGHLQVKPDRVAYRGQVRYRRPRPCRYHDAPTVRSTFIVAADGTVHAPATEYQTDVVGAGYGWSGHRRIIIGTRTQSRGKVARKARVRVERATAPAKRGKLVSWWSMSDRTLPRWWAKADPTQQATADTLESILRTSAHDARVELADGHVVVIDASVSMVRRDEPNSRMMPIREYARRAALAGLTID